jgi:hypothetical protein
MAQHGFDYEAMRRRALYSALMSTSSGFMQAGAPSLLPGGNQAALGQGLMGATQGYNNSMMNMARMRQQDQRYNAQQERQGRIEEAATARSLQLQQNWQADFDAKKDSKERKMFKGADGFNYWLDDQTRVLPDSTGAAPKVGYKTIERGDIKETYETRDGVIGAEPIATAPRYKPAAANITIGKEESAYGKKVGEDLGGRREEIRKRAVVSEEVISLAGDLKTALESVRTGPLEPSLAWLSDIARNLGFSLEDLASDIGVNLNDETARVIGPLAAKLTLEAEKKYPGRRTNMALSILQETLPKLGKDKGANIRIIDQLISDEGGSVPTYNDMLAYENRTGNIKGFDKWYRENKIGTTYELSDFEELDAASLEDGMVFDGDNGLVYEVMKVGNTVKIIRVQ